MLGRIRERELNRILNLSEDLGDRRIQEEVITNEEIVGLLNATSEMLGVVVKASSKRRLRRVLRVWGDILLKRKAEEAEGIESA